MDKAPAKHPASARKGSSPSPMSSGGFTFLEIIIVIGLIAFVYVIALPNFNLLTGNEVASRLGRLAEDIKSAYDYSVLRGKTVRLAFRLDSGDYWLETTDAEGVSIVKEKLGSDLIPQTEEQRIADFNDEFQKYIDLAGEAVKDPEDDDAELKIETPLIKAKEALQGPSWYQVDSMEWQNRSLGNHLILRDFQSEHLDRPISLENNEPGTIALLYFLPQGYAEKAVMHIYYKTPSGEVDTKQSPYTIFVHPHEGIAEVKPGYEELDFNRETSD